MAPDGLAKPAETAGIEEMDKDSSSTGMVRHLARANEKLLDLKATRDCAAEASDSVSKDLTIARIQTHVIQSHDIQSHEKTFWMLNS